MPRLVTLILRTVVLLTAFSLSAANLKLYLAEGGFHLVREFQVEGDRVRYYSVERSDWEEIPLALVDLKRTEAESAALKETVAKESKAVAEEEEAAREIRAEIRKIPRDPGVYQLENGELRILNLADVVVHTDKGRQVWKALSPIPLVPGKATFETNGERASTVVKDNRPEFFLQLSEFQPFAIVKLTPRKGVRIFERITVHPVTKETLEERDAVPIFQKQLSDNGLYKIWPQDALEKGEYAVMEYTDGKLNARIWDFRIEQDAKLGGK